MKSRDLLSKLQEQFQTTIQKELTTEERERCVYEINQIKEALDETLEGLNLIQSSTPLESMESFYWNALINLFVMTVNKINSEESELGFEMGSQKDFSFQQEEFDKFAGKVKIRDVLLAMLDEIYKERKLSEKKEMKKSLYEEEV